MKYLHWSDCRDFPAPGSMRTMPAVDEANIARTAAVILAEAKFP